MGTEEWPFLFSEFIDSVFTTHLHKWGLSYKNVLCKNQPF